MAKEETKPESGKPKADPDPQPSPLFLLQKQLTLEKQVGEELRTKVRGLQTQLDAADKQLARFDPDDLEVVLIGDAVIGDVPKGIGTKVARVRLGAGVTLAGLVDLIAADKAGVKKG